MNQDGLPHLRSSLRQGPALRIAQLSPNAPRLVEGSHPAQVAGPRPSRFSFWQFSLRAIPVIAAVVSTSLLAYFLLSERSQPHAQLQQQYPQQEQVAQSGGQQGAQGGGQQAPQGGGGGGQLQGSQNGGQQFAQNGPQPSAQQQLQPQQRLSMPKDDKLLMMILSSIVALNQANATGNYSVLRELGAPGFQKANSAARLSEIFSALRRRKLDLTPILLFQPKLLRKPEINEKDRLRINGFFPTTPERVNFDLLFAPVQGQWRLFGIGVSTSRPKPAAAPPTLQVAPAPEASGAGSRARPRVEPQAAKPAPPAPKPKPKAKVDQAPAQPKASSSDVDIRDRLDHPPPAPAPEKPKQKSIWNPFGR